MEYGENALSGRIGTDITARARITTDNTVKVRIGYRYKERRRYRYYSDRRDW